MQSFSRIAPHLPKFGERARETHGGFGFVILQKPIERGAEVLVFGFEMVELFDLSVFAEIRLGVFGEFDAPAGMGFLRV